MKISLPWLAAALSAAFLSSAAVSAQEGPPPPPPHVMPGGPLRRERPRMEKVAFLGVDVGPVSEDLGAQLGLPEYTGLAVEHVAPGSPADHALQPHDVLTKLDDQLLVDWRQFVVLVRNHHAGDEVTLAYIRGGKPGTVTVKLGEREAPKLFAFDAYIGPFMGQMQAWGKQYSEQIARQMHMAGEQVRRAQKEVQEELRMGRRGDGPGSDGNVDIRYTSEGGRTIELTVQDGKRNLTVTGPDKKQIFSGPVDTPEERASLAPDVRRDLENLEHMRTIRMEGPGRLPPPPPVPAAPDSAPAESPQAAI
jgi:serine protease Do